MIFATISAFVCLFIVLMMPKRLSLCEFYTSWGVIVAMALAVDGELGTVFNLYYFFQANPNLYEIVFQLIIPPSLGIIFLNFMPEQWKSFIFYLVGWWLFSLVYEYFAVKFHYLNYVNWSLWHSVPAYLLLFLILRYHLYLLRNKFSQKH